MGLYISVSSAGTCPRRIIFEKGLGIKQEETDRMKRLFFDGHLHEESILQWAVENIPDIKGGTTADYQREVKIPINTDTDFIFYGKIDGIAYTPAPVLLEAKTTNGYKFLRMQKYGILKEAPTYFVQVQLYMHGLRLEGLDIDRAYIVVRNMDTPRDRFYEHYWERIDYDEHAIREYIREALKIEELYTIAKEWNGTLEDFLAKYHDMLPPTFGNPYITPCSWCHLKHICYPDAEEEETEIFFDMDIEEAIEKLEMLQEEYNEQGKALKKQIDALKKQIIQMLGAGKSYRYGEKIYMVKQVHSSSVDTKAVRKLLEEQPELAKQVLKEVVYEKLVVQQSEV
jgi:hypothetical protein